LKATPNLKLKLKKFKLKKRFLKEKLFINYLFKKGIGSVLKQFFWLIKAPKLQNTFSGI